MYQLLKHRTISLMTIAVIAQCLTAGLPGTAAMPILQTVAKSETTILPNQHQVDEVIDLGTLRLNGPSIQKVVTFTVPDNQSLYKITPDSPTHFRLSSTGAYLTAQSNRVIKLVVSPKTSEIGTHQQLLTIQGNSQTIKRVLLKAKIEAVTKPSSP
jgi:hypothetical protein